MSKRAPVAATSAGSADSGADHYDSNSSDRTSKRISIDVACIECRKRKKKCDGRRPGCSLCYDTGRRCTYPVDSRAAMRNDNKHLRESLTALEDIFRRIRNSSAEDAAAIVGDIQSGRPPHELASLLNNYGIDGIRPIMSDGIHSSGADGHRSSGADGVHSVGTDGVHFSGVDGDHSGGTDSNRFGGTDGAYSGAMEGVRFSGTDGAYSGLTDGVRSAVTESIRRAAPHTVRSRAADGVRIGTLDDVRSEAASSSSYQTSTGTKRQRLSFSRSESQASTTRSDMTQSASQFTSTPPTVPSNRHVFINFVYGYRKVIADAMTKFNTINGNIFYTYTHQQVTDLCDMIGRLSADQVDNATLCEICAIAALAGQFSRDEIDITMIDLYYSIAKQTLDDCIVARPMRAMKVAALLSMYNVVAKATAALAFVHIGLSITKYQGLDRPERPDWWEETTWVDAKKVSRSLFFLKAWMEAALGFCFSAIDVPDTLSPDQVFVDRKTTDIQTEDFFQCEMTKVSILKAEMMKLTKSDDVTTSDLTYLRNKLGKWYEDLPKSMQLANLLTSDLTARSRMTLMYMHLYHLGAVIFLQRKVMYHALRVTKEQRPNSHWTSPEALEFVKKGIIAGRQGARILSIMQEEDNSLSRQCWIVIFHSFITSTTALYCAFQRINIGQSPSIWIEDAFLARRSYRALQICAEVDTVARQLQTRLEPYVSLLHSIQVTECRSQPPTPGSDQIFISDQFFGAPVTDFAFALELPTGDGQVQVSCRDLADLICDPLGSDGSYAAHSDTSIPDISYFRPPPLNPDEICIGAHVEWDWTSLNREGAGRGGPSGHSLPTDSRGFGTFADGRRPYGWQNERSTQDYLQNASTLDPISSRANTSHIPQ
ncbi:fungal Zn(2)-Cys(6) binuclear cluster domain-containing protein 14 [Elsinoe australis]|uniref:Fungal Zn(2)-Cys(6) binuclear cluster domain-containing protein 14 n=1 Tax=Elsinoe australis TaxID=40998 RepID=A0A4U7B0P8_9PEZI|nr:fungal Zn(2)-Cys(6) binuclear cluster domain-containing protein 14 [Elsinoe australis]